MRNGKFDVIPAVDIKNGKCVRLVQGDKDRETIYFNSPADAACDWEKAGAKRLHLVDLDGAFDGKPHNTDIIRSIRANVDMEIELGGGLRTVADAKLYLDMGIDHVIIGTSAYSEPETVSELIQTYGPERIYVGADCRDERVAIKGWVEKTSIEIGTFLSDLSARGVKTFIVTDVSTDGMLGGPNVELYKRLLAECDIDLIASGGIGSAADVKTVRNIEGISGCIIGKALYDGRLTLGEVL